MVTTDQLHTVLAQWRTVLGHRPRLGPDLDGRELWPVTADDGRRYFLKRLGPWRNLPVADQGRILAYLSSAGISVAAFVITDDARIFAGQVEDSYVVVPMLPSDQLEESEVLVMEASVGGAVARLHGALAKYPWPANSYQEQMVETLTGDLRLRADVRDGFAPHRQSIVDSLAALPLQLVHGDLTPENVLLSRSGRAPAFIDFDHLPLAPRLWDIAKYLSRRLREHPSTEGLRHVERFVTGYREVLPLTDDELAAVAGATVALNVLEVDWTQQIVSGELDRRLLPGQVEDLRTTADTLRWQFQNLAALEDAARGRLS